MSYHFTAAECRKILACHYGKHWHSIKIAEELEEKFGSNATDEDIEIYIAGVEYNSVIRGNPYAETDDVTRSERTHD